MIELVRYLIWESFKNIRSGRRSRKCFFNRETCDINPFALTFNMLADNTTISIVDSNVTVSYAKMILDIERWARLCKQSLCTSPTNEIPYQTPKFARSGRQAVSNISSNQNFITSAQRQNRITSERRNYSLIRAKLNKILELMRFKTF